MKARTPAPWLRSLLFLLAAGALCAAAPNSATAVAGSSSALERAYELDAGKAGKRDASAAAKLYADAAAAGDAVAHLRLGYLYETGDGVPQDYAQARSHYQAAANAGLADGHVHLGICHLEGWGGPVDRTAFVSEIRLAADTGDINAERIMAGIYAVGIGVPRDSALALQWLERAAKQGDPESAASLGQQAEHEQVRRLMHDEALARSWYQLSAEKDYTEGMRAMARTFLTGPKQDRNWELGHRWLELALEGGDAEAPYILAVYEIIGVDAPTHDEARALAWLKLASERHNEKATEVLQLHEGGKSLDAAFRYMLQVPFDERYVQRQLAQRTAGPTQPPLAYKVVKPVYPMSLRMTGVEGRVLVDFIVDTTGRVRNAFALESPHPLFSERAVRAVEQWRFYPARKDGRLVNTHMRVPIYFDLKGEELLGADGLLRLAGAAAERLGADVQADASDLMLAHALTKINVPPGADGQPVKNARSLILLVVDPSGVPMRGHVLDASPKEVGAQVLEAAMHARFIPKREGDETVTSHQVLAFSTAPHELFDRALKR